MHKFSSLLKGKPQTSATTKAITGFTAFDAWMNVQNGDDIGTAAVKAGTNQILWSMAPVPMGIATFGAPLAQGAYQAGVFHYRKQQWWNKQFHPNGEVGGNYMDSQRALTMRQAAVQAIQGSKLNARSSLGGEARIMSPYGPYR